MLSLITIGTSSTTFILGTDPSFQDYNATSGTKPTPIKELATVEVICLGIFTVEYLVRLCCCWAVRTEIFDRNELLKITPDYEAIHLKVPFMKMVDGISAPSMVFIRSHFASSENHLSEKFPKGKSTPQI